MKKIILVRHGKSSWDYDASDINRPLLQRGLDDGLAVSKEFLQYDVQIDFALSSPAIRALHTSMIFLKTIDFDLSKFRVLQKLYDFSGNDVLEVIKGLDDKLNTVMLFGHNHAFTHIANSLGNNYIDNVPTSGLVMLNFNIEKWAELTKGRTENIIFAKHLDND